MSAAFGEKLHQRTSQSDVNPDVSSLEANEPVKDAHTDTAFPEGGARAWSVAFGAGVTMFSTFGYVNAFG